MKTIKLIDLLNKIANGEEVSKRIRYEYKDYVYKDNYEDYYCEEESRYLFEIIVNDENWKLSYTMNIEVEILEEEKKIPEKINICIDNTNMEYIKGKTYGKNYSKSAIEIAHTINEIIDYLKSKGE